jgi:hypothetical protein
MRLETELRSGLASGEQVLWLSMPDPTRLKAAFAMWLFAIPWTAFSLAWTGLALAAYLSSFGAENNGGAPWWAWVMPLFGTPFIAVGVFMLRMPFAARADAKYTLYALTNRRLIALTHRKAKTVKSVDLNKLGPVTVNEKDGGWGDLSVETGSSFDSDGDRRTDRFEIAAVPNVAGLHRLLLEQRRA